MTFGRMTFNAVHRRGILNGAEA